MKNAEQTKNNVIQVSFQKDEVEIIERIKNRKKKGTISGWVKDAIEMRLEYEENMFFDQSEVPYKQPGYVRPNQPDKNTEVLPFNVDSILDSF